MKPYTSFLAFLFLLFTSSHCHADQLIGVVVGVSDGDTIHVLAENTEHKIRLLGIDAPEKEQPYGQASKKSLSDQIYNQSVVVDWKKLDRYGRKVGKVLINGVDANLVQVKRGLAWHYKKYENEQPSEDRSAYANAEVEARQTKTGLWQEPNPVPPWDWRKAKRGN